MAAGPITQVADIIVTNQFSKYVQQLTAQKARIVQAGVLEPSALLDDFLANQGGLTFNIPSLQDLDDDDDNVSTDAAGILTGGSAITPKKIGSSQEIAVRLSRNQIWSSADLAAALGGIDLEGAIADRSSYYWARKLQKAFIATLTGVFADNTANDSGDFTNDVSGSSYTPGITDFSSEAFIDAIGTAGDSSDEFATILVHSKVHDTMKKKNLIDQIPDARGEVSFKKFQGLNIVVDDGLPVPSTGVYESWIFGNGAVKLGSGVPKYPVELARDPSAGNGGGQDILINRVEWSIHPTGFQFNASSPANGGPSNAATTNNLAAATSWDRVYPERKQIKIARLITREA